MKKILIIIIGIFVLVGSTYIVLFYNSEQFDRFPLSEKKIISEFEQFKSTNNNIHINSHINILTTIFTRCNLFI